MQSAHLWFLHSTGKLTTFLQFHIFTGYYKVCGSELSRQLKCEKLPELKKHHKQEHWERQREKQNNTKKMCKKLL